MSDDRAVSTVVGFVLTLGITSLLVIGLLVGIGGFVDDQRRGTVRDELEVLGQQIAADIAASDRLARSGDTTTVTLDRSLPSSVTGVSYRITTSYSGGVTTIGLSTENPDVSVDVQVRTETPVDGGTTLNGGDIQVVYNPGAPGELVIQDG